MDFIFDPSLVLYLPLYKLGGASFLSRDKHGHLCSVTGAIWTPRGRSFDGSDDLIDCGAGTSLDITNTITLEAWVKLSSTPAGHHSVIGKWKVATDERCYWLDMDKGANNWRFDVSHEGSDYVSVTGSAPATDWIHLVGTFDGTDAKIYEGGAWVNMANGPGVINSVAANHVWVGASGDVPDRFFPGLIGEVRIYNRALTPLEIQHNYLATKWRYR